MKHFQRQCNQVVFFTFTFTHIRCYEIRKSEIVWIRNNNQSTTTKNVTSMIDLSMFDSLSWLCNKPYLILNVTTPPFFSVSTTLSPTSSSNHHMSNNWGTMGLKKRVKYECTQSTKTEKSNRYHIFVIRFPKTTDSSR